MARQPVTSKVKKLLFLDFYNETGNASYRWAKNTIPDNIDKAIKNKYRYSKISSAKWQKYVKENGYKPVDLFDEDKISAMGKALGANGIIYGKFKADTKNNRLEISGRILSVVDAEIVAEKDKVTPISSEMFTALEEVSDYLAKNIDDLFLPSNSGALWRSSVAPGWGQFYKERNTWGYIYMGSIGAAVGSGLFFTTNFLIDSRNYTNAGPDDNPDGIFQSAKTNLQIATISFAVAGLFYLVNLFDAYFFQGDYGEVLKGSAQLPDVDLYLKQAKIASLHGYGRAEGLHVVGVSLRL